MAFSLPCICQLTHQPFKLRQVAGAEVHSNWKCNIGHLLQNCIWWDYLVHDNCPELLSRTMITHVYVFQSRKLNSPHRNYILRIRIFQKKKFNECIQSVLLTESLLILSSKLLFARLDLSHICTWFLSCISSTCVFVFKPCYLRILIVLTGGFLLFFRAPKAATMILSLSLEDNGASLTVWCFSKCVLY
jgi:hypothetical protein